MQCDAAQDILLTACGGPDELPFAPILAPGGKQHIAIHLRLDLAQRLADALHQHPALSGQPYGHDLHTIE